MRNIRWTQNARRPYKKHECLKARILKSTPRTGLEPVSRAWKAPMLTTYTNEDCCSTIDINMIYLYILRRNLMQIQFQNLGLRLRGRSGAVILAGVSGCLQASKLTAIMGPSGAGKWPILWSKTAFIDSTLCAGFAKYRLYRSVPKLLICYCQDCKQSIWIGSRHRDTLR
jgi:hypothetical protein